MKDKQREVFTNLVQKELPDIIKNKSTMIADDLKLSFQLMDMESNILMEYMDTYKISDSVELFYDKCLQILNTDPYFSIQDDINSFWEMDCNNSHVCNYCSFDKIDMGDVAV